MSEYANIKQVIVKRGLQAVVTVKVDPGKNGADVTVEYDPRNEIAVSQPRSTRVLIGSNVGQATTQVGSRAHGVSIGGGVVHGAVVGKNTGNMTNTYYDGSNAGVAVPTPQYTGDDDLPEVLVVLGKGVEFSGSNVAEVVVAGAG